MNLELRHPCCVCNIKVQCKEVKNTTSLLSINSVINETYAQVNPHTGYLQKKIPT